MDSNKRSVPWIFWPFQFLWDILSAILNITGRLIAGILGFVAMIIGLILTFTVVAAPVGIPIMLVGILLLTRSIF